VTARLRSIQGERQKVVPLKYLPCKAFRRHALDGHVFEETVGGKKVWVARLRPPGRLRRHDDSGRGPEADVRAHAGQRRVAVVARRLTSSPAAGRITPQQVKWTGVNWPTRSPLVFGFDSRRVRGKGELP
jgi:hypothetical protein